MRLDDSTVKKAMVIHACQTLEHVGIDQDLKQRLAIVNVRRCAQVVPYALGGFGARRGIHSFPLRVGDAGRLQAAAQERRHRGLVLDQHGVLEARYVLVRKSLTGGAPTVEDCHKSPEKRDDCRNGGDPLCGRRSMHAMHTLPTAHVCGVVQRRSHSWGGIRAVASYRSSVD
jgi:hypothetical protein